MLQHHLNLIKEFYGDRTAKRSGVPLINHINEGLVILKEEAAPTVARAAYCIHPIIQDTNDFFEELGYRRLAEAYCPAVMLACEYRSVANSYLSHMDLDVVQKQNLRRRVGEIPHIAYMLTADKIQNRKDFEKYHEGTHENSDRLAAYFRDWMLILDISESRYQIYKKLLD